MQYVRMGEVLLVLTLGISAAAWGQGGNGRAGRAAGAQSGTPATAPAATAGRGGRGGDTGAGATEFFNYDPSAGSGLAIPDSQPVETHQKITVNGEALAYTARAGYMSLRNATTGQSEAHLFYTCYSKDGVADPASRPLLFFLGGAPGVAATWQEFGGLGPKRMKWASDGTAGMPPYAWVDNPHTLLGAGRSGLREPRRHRVQPSRSAVPRPQLLEYGRRRRLARGVRAEFPQCGQSPELAALSGGRGFWHGARGGSGRLPQRTPDPGSWRGAALDDSERRCPRRRRAIHHAAAQPDSWLPGITRSCRPN